MRLIYFLELIEKRVWRNSDKNKPIRPDRINNEAKSDTDTIKLLHKRRDQTIQALELIERDIQLQSVVKIESDGLSEAEALSKEIRDAKLVLWINKRIIFGISLAKAIETWMSVFRATGRSPARETGDVIAAWTRYQIIVAFIAALIPAAVTIGTVYYLSKQYALSVSTQVRTQRFSYLGFLFDVECPAGQHPGPQQKSRVGYNVECTPVHNRRIRSEALQSFIDIEKQRVNKVLFVLSTKSNESIALNNARLGTTYAVRDDWSSIVVDGANLSNSMLYGTNMTDLSATKTNFENAILSKADLTNAVVNDAILKGATFKDAILAGTDFSGSDLRFAKHLSQKQLDLACGDEKTQLTGDLNVSKCP